MTAKTLATAVAISILAGASYRTVVADNPEGPRSCSVVAGSEVCTWLVMDGDTPVELGASIPLALVESVPADAEMVWPPEELGTVAFPPEVRSTLGLHHLTLNWEAHGHPPATFMEPHFDFHVYNVDAEDVHAIDCSDVSKPQGIPSGFVLPDMEAPGLGTLVGLCVPRMGMHAMLQADASQGEPFEASMIVGYYEGEPIFFEPMVSRARLLKRTSFSLPIPVVSDLPAGVRYPTRLDATYEAGDDQYRLVFSGF